MRFVILGFSVFVAAYVATITLYSSTGLGHPTQLTKPQPTIDGTTATLDLEELHSIKGELVADLTISPGSELLDPVTHNLKEDLRVAVTSTVGATTRTWSEGTLPGVFPVVLTIFGDTAEYPFDHYSSGPVAVELFRGAERTPQRLAVSFFDRLPGWKIYVSMAAKADDLAPYRLSLKRSPSTAVFASIVLGAMVVMATAALFVAIQTTRGRRKFQPPMLTWFVTMIFAVIPLRNALPDSPPIGFWIDVTVVLWVIVALVTSMVLYVSCWWRHLNPAA